MEQPHYGAPAGNRANEMAANGWLVNGEEEGPFRGSSFLNGNPERFAFLEDCGR